MINQRRHLPHRGRDRRTTLVLVALLSITLLSIPRAEATIVRYRTIRSMATISDAIVRGTVVKSVAIWRNRTAVTQTTIQLVADYSKRQIRDRSVVIESPGGTVGGLVVQVSGSPSFKVGDEVVLFLRRHRNGGYRTIGLALGVFRLSLVKGEWFAVRQTRDLHVVRSPKDTTAVTPMPTFHLDDLIDVIRDAQRQSTTSP
ncbi:MAG: hypothetical protein KC609_19150 [Myxococcales bacterium]|nr:hypothetical protein [Myxococcales bacterium]